MSNKTVEIKVSEEVYALIKKAAEHGRRKGRGEAVPCTIGEMAADYVQTGVYRRISANKWAREHAAPKKIKVKAVKTKKPAKVQKISKPKKASGSKKTKPVKVKAPASKSAAAPAATSMLE